MCVVVCQWSVEHPRHPRSRNGCVRLWLIVRHAAVSRQQPVDETPSLCAEQCEGQNDFLKAYYQQASIQNCLPQTPTHPRASSCNRAAPATALSRCSIAGMQRRSPPTRPFIWVAVWWQRDVIIRGISMAAHIRCTYALPWIRRSRWISRSVQR